MENRIIGTIQGVSGVWTVSIVNNIPWVGDSHDWGWAMPDVAGKSDAEIMERAESKLLQYDEME